MIDYSPCKINIGLEIISKRSDGYHNIETIMYPVPLYDIIEVVPYTKSSFEFSQSGIIVDGAVEDNLLYKAWKLINDSYFIGGIKVHLHKQIPIGAGLGGGSSDAVGMLKILNKKFNLAISEDKLRLMAAALGADCPFFVSAKPAYAYNTGTDLKEILLDLSNYYILLVKPNIHISTQEAYKGIALSSKPSYVSPIADIPIEEWKDKVVNSFENKLFDTNIVLREIKEKLYAMGAVYASMSGSGAAIFGLFENLPAEGSFPEKYFQWISKL